MAKITGIAIHHTGGLGRNLYASTQYLTAQQVEYEHRLRWDFISSLGKYGGYNFYIERDGKWTQYRAVGEETAAQLGRNFDTVSICLAGNFTLRSGVPVDSPTSEQCATLQSLCIALVDNGKTVPMLDKMGVAIAPNTEINIPIYNIRPHRFYSQTECYGYLPDNWARDLVTRNYQYYGAYQYIFALILDIWASIARNRKLAGIDTSCGAQRG